jgi:hypothetical protein
MATIVGELAKLIRYTDKLLLDVKDLIQGKQKANAAKLFRKTSEEIYENLTTLRKKNLDEYKDCAINSLKIKSLINKDLKTVYVEKFLDYSKKIPQIKKKDKKKLADKLSLSLCKIHEMRKYAAMPDKKLRTLKGFRPAVRLQNIRKVYLGIIKVLKETR